MLLILFSAPASLLGFYLAWLCYRKALYPHTLVLALFALLFLFITAGLLGAGFLAGLALHADSAPF